ncbi:hypothetical protein TorRG33x02_075430 [Trema orientale]|uniref:Uncharacterized protein n=1 Tax=Trema orientale TaxID=63057 RepID=A0A2P5FFK7_TREOI|nr:hypothetical protein TorRG33x02_075430 [Trema orientale]
MRRTSPRVEKGIDIEMGENLDLGAIETKVRDAESKFLEGSVIAGLRSQCDKGRVMDYDSFGCVRNNVDDMSSQEIRLLAGLDALGISLKTEMTLVIKTKSVQLEVLNKTPDKERELLRDDVRNV